MAHGSDKESLEAFFKSLSYGTRTDLNFKWLSFIASDDAISFMQLLLRYVTDALDTQDLTQLHELIRDAQTRAYGGIEPKYVYEDKPFAPLTKPIDQARLTLLTSSGHYVDGDDPEPFGIANLTQGDVIERIDEFLKEPPDLSEVPFSTPLEKIRVRHPGYDIEGAKRDHNVNFPLDSLLRLSALGKINLYPNAYSFVGACLQTPLRKRVAPNWASDFKQKGVDAVLLVPV